MIVAVDLFCGVGGITHGFIKEGIDVRAGIDLDSTCRYAFEKNNKVEFLEKDIRDVKASEIKRLFSDGEYSVLVGCAPCQTFSKHTQKNKNRNRDQRWSLIREFCKLAKRVKPDFISMENVPQISQQHIFHEFVTDLKKAGYFVSWNIVFCPDYGIPQNRKRLVLLASRHGELNIINKTHKKEKYRTVEDAIKGLPVIRHGSCNNKDPLHRSYSLSELNYKRIQHSKPGGSWKSWPKELLLKCHKKKTGSTYTTVYGRMKWSEPSPTITTQFYSYGTGRFGHPSQNRALSLREGALLQTFPKSYKFIDPNVPFSTNDIGKHIGNAVPVRLSCVIAKSIKKHVDNIKNRKS